MGGIFSPAKPAAVVTPAAAPTQDSAATAAAAASAADAARRQGRAANQSAGTSPDNIDSQTNDNYSVRKKLLGN